MICGGETGSERWREHGCAGAWKTRIRQKKKCILWHVGKNGCVCETWPPQKSTTGDIEGEMESQQWEEWEEWVRVRVRVGVRGYGLGLGVRRTDCGDAQIH